MRKFSVLKENRSRLSIGLGVSTLAILTDRLGLIANDFLVGLLFGTAIGLLLLSLYKGECHHKNSR